MNQNSGRQASVNLSNRKTYDPQTNTTFYRGVRQIIKTKRDNTTCRPNTIINKRNNNITRATRGNLVAISNHDRSNSSSNNTARISLTIVFNTDNAYDNNDHNTKNNARTTRTDNSIINNGVDIAINSTVGENNSDSFNTTDNTIKT